MIKELDEINSFIGRFKFQDEKALDHYFMNGGCYYFALILKNLYPGGEIYYNQVDNHFCYGIANKFGDTSFYDIRGMIDDHKGFVLWEKYKIDEPLDAARVVDYCVYRTKGA